MGPLAALYNYSVQYIILFASPMGSVWSPWGPIRVHIKGPGSIHNPQTWVCGLETNKKYIKIDLNKARLPWGKIIYT